MKKLLFKLAIEAGHDLYPSLKSTRDLLDVMRYDGLITEEEWENYCEQAKDFPLISEALKILT